MSPALATWGRHRRCPAPGACLRQHWVQSSLCASATHRLATQRSRLHLPCDSGTFQIGNNSNGCKNSINQLNQLINQLLNQRVRGYLRNLTGLADFVDANRQALAVTSAILLSFVEQLSNSCKAIDLNKMVPWIQISKSRSILLMVKPTTFLVAVIMGGLLHVLLLCFNSSAVPTLALISGGSKSPFAKEENASALTLVASQKTLPVTIAVVEQLGGALGESGLLVLPCVAAHLNQIIIDSFLVSLWKRKKGKLGTTKEA